MCVVCILDNQDTSYIVDDNIPLYILLDFLPIFIYTLIHTGIKEIEVEFLYTWNLVDQNLLSGEGGYYLTTLCTASQLINTYIKHSPNTVLNSLARSSLHVSRLSFAFDNCSISYISLGQVSSIYFVYMYK